MTIPEPTEGDLSSNMFENMGVAPRKTAQWQPTQNVASMRHLFRLIADPNPSQEMDLVDQDTCLSRPYDTLNAESFGEDGEDQEHGLMPTCTQSSTGLSYHRGTTNVEPVEESTKYASHPAVPQDGQDQVRVYTQGTGLLSHSGRFNGEPVLYTTRLAPHQEDQEQVRICTQGTSHLGKCNAEHVGETAHPAGVREAREQGPMLTYMQCSDQSRQLYGTQNREFSVSPEMHMWNTQTKHHPGTCNMEPNRHIPSPSDMAQKDLMQRSAVTSKQGTCFRPGSGMVNTNPLGEPAPVACPQMQWPSFGIDGGTPLWSRFDTTITRPFVKFRPAAAAVQDPEWVAINMHDTCYKGHSGPTNVKAFIQGESLPNIQGENFLGHSAVCNTDSSGRQMSLPAVVQDNQVMPEQVQHRWASTNTHDSNLFSHQGSCNPQAFGGFETLASPQVTELEGQTQGCALTNTALLHQFGAFNANNFVLNGVQEDQVQTYALTNTALLCQFGTCNANPSVNSSAEVTGNHNRTILTTGYCTSTQKALEDLEALSKNITDALPDMGHMHQSPSACGNAGARTGQHGTMVSKCRRLSALRTVMRKGKSAEGRGDDRGELDPNKEPQLKPRRKKLRAKVLKDRSKSKVRRGSKTGKGKDIPEATGLHGDEGLAARDGKIAEAGYPSLGETSNFSQLEPFQEGITKKSLCQDDGQGFELFCHEGTIYGDESASAGTGLSINRQESSSWHKHSKTGEDQVAVPNSETYTLVDYFALSECRAGLRDPLLGNAGIEPKRLASECREVVLYGQCSEEPEAPHSHSSNLPLCLFSGETSSSGSTKLVPSGGSSSHLPLAKVAPDDNLQLVLYNQKRDIIVSKLARTFKKIRAKVQLDPESQRVWLQLENGGGPQDDSDPDKARHWEKEREVMKKKVDFFIHKMHVVQGDRRFSPWKGSIVDSVVGAFLTQNVSDHLSSSAFMSVASRFPPVLKKDSVVARADEICTIPCEKQCDVEVLPFIMEKGFFGSEEELSLDKQGDVNSNNSLCDDESTAVEVGSGEVTGFCKPVQHDDRRRQSLYGDYEGGVSIVYEGYYNASPDSQPCEKKVHHLLLASDDERNSSCAIEEDVDDGGGTMEDVCGAFRQCCTLRNSKARRMLNFGTEVDKQEPAGTCSVLETVKQVSFAPMHDTEMASDNISDQQSESESAVGSSSTVQSVQDSNFQLVTVQESNRELDFQNNMIQASSQELDTAAAPQVDSKTGKKRPLSISSMSGIERAQLEVSQKGRKKNHHRDWESVRKQVLGIPGCGKENSGAQKPRSHAHEDSVNWDAVRLSDLGELADTIKERGMHHVLSGRIKAFLTSLYEEHGSVDLEWLRNLSTETAREYLMSIHGLGVKSVECIRLLTLHHLAFPVDTNVGRICVRLGWVPIEPLPEEVQLHLVELYPIQETIQKYLWPRLCTLDQRTLYELHYQLITFGKVFCTKSKPNCNACPMRTECKHFASAYASAKPLLTGPKEEQSNRICSGSAHKEIPVLGMDTVETALLDYPPQDKPIELSLSEEAPLVSEIDSNTTFSFEYHNRPLGASYSEDFYVEEPASPEPTYGEDITDIEDMGAHMYIYKNYNDYSLDLIGNDLSLVQSTNHSLVALGDQCSSQDMKNVHTQSTLSTDNSQFDASHLLLSKDQCCSPYQCSNGDLASTSPRIPYCGSQSITRSDTTSDRPTYQTDIIIEVAQNAIVSVPEVAQIPAPKLKNIGRLRTIHYVYELPDGHSLLKMVDVREKDDPCSYLLAIWSPGETPESQQEIDELCRDESSMHSADKSFGADETVSGTLLIPCRTAMHGSFPLNGTYFQVNEVFADHESSLHPLQVPRSLIWSLRRRFVYFGTSVPNIFKGLSTDEIKDCFWRGHVCVRGFDRQTRAPKPLVCRLHFPISKQQQKANKKHKGKKNDEKSGISSTLHK